MPVIFLTAYSDNETVNRAMETMPASYLVKPVNDKQLKTSINLAMNRFADLKIRQEAEIEKKEKAKESDHFILNDNIFIKMKEKFYKVKLSDILWIEAGSNYSTIITPSHKYTILLNLGAFFKKLQKNTRIFVRIHRSYTINIEHINSFDISHVHFKNKKIPIGKSYRDDFYKRIGYVK